MEPVSLHQYAGGTEGTADPSRVRGEYVACSTKLKDCRGSGATQTLGRIRVIGRNQPIVLKFVIS